MKGLSSKCNFVSTCVWTLLSCFSTLIAGHTAFNATSVQTVLRGKSVNISCNYKRSNDTEGVTVKLETYKELCSAMSSNNSWIRQLCKDHIRFIWIRKTHNVSFEVSNLQINDAGIYKCVVTRSIPPPVVPLGEERTFIQVIARPIVTVSHAQGSDGFPMILCSSEGFYPSVLHQVWMRNGEFQNISLTHNMNKSNPDGSFTHHSYLNISDCAKYSCWVNHSTLSQPAILHLPLIHCSENRGTWVFIFVLIASVFLIAVLCRCQRSCQQPVDVSFTSEFKTEALYSVLRDNCHPVLYSTSQLKCKYVNDCSSILYK